MDTSISTYEPSKACVDSLLNGKQPTPKQLGSDGGKKLAESLALSIDIGVAPSKCAHAMCAASASGAYEIVLMLSKRPKETFNKAYNFNEPLLRASRSWAKTLTNSPEEANFEKCMTYLLEAGGNLDAPGKYLSSKKSAADSILDANRTKHNATTLLSILRGVKAVSSEKKLKTDNLVGKTNRKKRKATQISS